MFHGSRSFRRSTGWWGALLAVVVVAGSAGGGPASAADDDGDKQSPFLRIFEAGAALGRYPDANENANGQFIRMRWEKRREYDFQFTVGRQQRFGHSSVGVGANYGRLFAHDTKLNFRLGAASGELIPRWSAGVSARRPFFDVAFILGYVHDDWKNGASNDRFSLGAQKWFKHVILSGAARYNINHPGSHTGWGGNVGVAYYRWRKLYLGVVHTFGDVRYEPIGFEDVLVEYEARGYYAWMSRWITDHSGINVRVGTAEPPDSYGVRASWFTEW